VLGDDVLARQRDELGAEVGEQRGDRCAHGVVSRGHRTDSPVTRLASAASARRWVVFTAPGFLPSTAAVSATERSATSRSNTTARWSADNVASARIAGDALRRLSTSS